MNKLIVLFAVLLLSVQSKRQIPLDTYASYVAKGFEELEHNFGGVHFKTETAEGTLSHVFLPVEGIWSDAEVVEKTFDQFFHPENYNNNLTAAPLEGCDRGFMPDYWKFFGQTAAILNATVTTYSYESPCFAENNFWINFIDDATVEIIHQAKGHRGFVCGDGYFISTMANFHVEAVYTEGIHKIVFNGLNANEMALIRESGAFIYRYCDSVVNIVPDVIKTALMFLGGLGNKTHSPIFSPHPNALQEWLNANFVKVSTGYTWEIRPNQTYIPLDKSLIKSGDFFAVIRFNGNDVAIELGSGSHVGHSVMALWIDGELNIVESQGGNWPKQGLQRNPYDTWMQYAQNSGYMVTWLPLKEEYAAAFNETACVEWFLTVEGMPYGYEAFLWGWIDTVNASYPTLMDPNYLASFMAWVDTIEPSFPNAMFTPGLNWRLGTDNLNMAQLAMVVAERGTTFPDLYAMVEQDGTLYNGHYAYTCSGFVTALWKAGGLFDGYTINAVEWTPRDIYQSIFIDPNPPVPEDCKAVDPENPYCQVMGKYRMQFPGISTVEIYSHMNEHCPSQPPLYDRTPGC